MRFCISSNERFSVLLIPPVLIVPELLVPYPPPPPIPLPPEEKALLLLLLLDPVKFGRPGPLIEGIGLAISFKSIVFNSFSRSIFVKLSSNKDFCKYSVSSSKLIFCGILLEPELSPPPPELSLNKLLNELNALLLLLFVGLGLPE